jgi:hypothetical protein
MSPPRLPFDGWLVGLVAICGGCTSSSSHSSASPDAGAASSAPDAGADAAAAPTQVVCPAPPVHADFEAPLDPSWPITDPSAFLLDSTAPISGKQSLRIAYRQLDSFITIPMPSVCSVQISFTFRAAAQLLSTGPTVFRVTAGPGSAFFLALDSHGLLISQTLETAGAASIGGGMPSGGPVAADTPTAVVATVDLRTKTTTLASAPVGKPLPTPVTSRMRVDPSNPSNPGPITAVDLGQAPGLAAEAVGYLWVDDLTIE